MQTSQQISPYFLLRPTFARNKLRARCPHTVPKKLKRSGRPTGKPTSTFQTHNHSDKPKYYVLDMFPYPSGAGLHVGHPLGYIASDIVTRYKRLRGFNVLHPMGFDSFGLPAEQYAIQTGQHPALTTEKNIETYISSSAAWASATTGAAKSAPPTPRYYKWTQWIFLKLFNSWYNLDTDRAEPLTELTARFAATRQRGHPRRRRRRRPPQLLGRAVAACSPKSRSWPPCSPTAWPTSRTPT